VSNFLFFDSERTLIISLLDAGTNDLAQFINHLDLEAMPHMTPIGVRNPFPPPKLAAV